MFANKSIDELYRIANTHNLSTPASSSNSSDLHLVVENSADTFDAVKLDLNDYAPVCIEKSPAVISWCDLTITTKIKNDPEPKILINHINGTITGGLWAIMGPSGSGKVLYIPLIRIISLIFLWKDYIFRSPFSAP